MADLRLPAALAAPSRLPHVLVMFGNDEAEVSGAASAVLAAWRSAAPTAPSLQHPAAAILTDPPLLTDHFANVGLFDDGALLHVPQATDRLAPLLSAALDAMPDDPGVARILISSASVKTKGALAKAAREHPRAGVIACFDVAPDASELKTLFSHRQVTFDGPGAEEHAVATLAGLDRASITAAIEKLSLYAHRDQPLSSDDVTDCLGASDAAAGDALLSALLTGDRDRALEAVVTQLRLGVDPSQIVAMLGRTLADLSSGLAHLDGAPGGRRLFWKLETALKDARRRVAGLPDRLAQASVSVHEAEKRLRSRPISPAAEVERLTLRVATIIGSGR